MTKADLDAIIAETQARKDAAASQHQQLQQQAMQLNQQGVQLERDMLVIDGELKALAALTGKVTE
jgi:hypothetical protein